LSRIHSAETMFFIGRTHETNEIIDRIFYVEFHWRDNKRACL